MNAVESSTASDRGLLHRRMALECGVATTLTVLTAVALAALVRLPPTFVVGAALMFSAVAACVWVARYRMRLAGALGPADRVTLARAGLLALLAGFVAVASHGAAIVWPFVIGVAAVLLDGVDGAVARRTGSASAFGARFDMELDAALALMLAVLVFAYDRVGLWVLLLGLPRYAFLLAAHWWRALRRPLPPSQRRRVICVVQVATLAGSLMPGVAPWFAASACVGAGALLYASFAVDIRQLSRVEASAGDPTMGEQP